MKYNEPLQLARAYVLYQEYDETYSPECALKHGTAFPGLYQPYKPCQTKANP